ncbi:hypothetical protein [Dactylosporangium salmoneum]|uniref:Protein phosphatase 2C domain-containing protein n=1 Tax=Dactylosporangium salmoneum TaxID=53361 RepID=A0ABN3HF05_9ACTN
MRVRFATAGAPGRVNEDCVLAVDGLVAVLDGVTRPAGLDDGCRHGPAWYARRLALRLHAAHAAAPGAGLADLLATAIDAVRGDHGGGCDLANPATPAATVCALRESGEYLVLGDSPLVLDAGEGVTVVADDRFERIAAGLAVHSDKYGHVNRPGGYWIAAADPRAAFEAVRGAAPRVRRAALLTDGASCAADSYGLLTWAELLDLVVAEGPAELIRRVRAEERADPDRARHPRHKRHDDATVAVAIR